MLRENIHQSLLKHLPDKRYSLLIGARQVGKTTVVKQVGDYLLSKNKKVFYFTLEEPEILKAINEHPENIFHFTLHPDELEPNERMFLLVDEIQYAQNPTNFLKLLYDKYADKIKIIATGSSAFYINRDFKDSLAGRKKIFELYTLSFTEFLHFKNEDALIQLVERMREKPRYTPLEHIKLLTLFYEYIVYGGYPAVVKANSTDDKKELLHELIQSYMKKDVLEADVKDEIKFFQLAKLLASQTGELVNQNELANTLKLSAGTIDNHLYLLRKCFHVSLLQPKFSNVRKELTKMPKVYFNDTGLRNTLLGNFDSPTNRLDKGALFENYIYCRLRDVYGVDKLNYWRTADGNEVDFIVEEQMDVGKAFEVKFNETQFKPLRYKKFVSAYPNYPLSPIVFQRENIDTKDALRF